MAHVRNTTGGRPLFGPPVHDIRSAASKATSSRTCDEPGCSTVLSRYNGDSSCWLHVQPSFGIRSAGRHGASR
jgi:hypothetical protein